MLSERLALITTSDPTVAETMAGLMAARGLTCVVVSDGEAAVAHLQSRGAPAIVIVDLGLPKLDGFAVIRALRALASPTVTPVVAVSSSLALRTRATEQREELGIGAVLSLQLPVPRLDQLIAPLLTPPAPAPAPAAVAAPASSALQVRVAEIARAVGVESVIVALNGPVGPVVRAHHGRAGHRLAELGELSGQVLGRHTIAGDRHEPLVVAAAFERRDLATHPLVAAGLLGSYVGVPLIGPAGQVLGTLCAIDPGAWLAAPHVLEALREEARTIVALLCPQPEGTFAKGSQAVAAIPASPAAAPAAPAASPARSVLTRLVNAARRPDRSAR